MSQSSVETWCSANIWTGLRKKYEQSIAFLGTDLARHVSELTQFVEYPAELGASFGELAHIILFSFHVGNASSKQRQWERGLGVYVSVLP